MAFFLHHYLIACFDWALVPSKGPWPGTISNFGYALDVKCAIKAAFDKKKNWNILNKFSSRRDRKNWNVARCEEVSYPSHCRGSPPLPRSAPPTDIPLLPSPVSEPRAHFMFLSWPPAFSPFFTSFFLIFCSAMTFWKWYCAFHRNPQVVCAATGYFYALNHLCDVKVPRMWCQFCWQEKRGSSEMAVRAFVWILSCFHGVHQCNTLQTRLSLHDLCAALVLQCPNLVRVPLSFPFPPWKQAFSFLTFKHAKLHTTD